MSVQKAETGEYETISRRLRTHASERPHRCALVEGDIELTYGELDRRLDDVAAGLRRDLGEGRHVIALIGGGGLPEVTILLGALRAGCIPALIAASATSEQIARMVSDSQAAIVFSHDPCALTEAGFAGRLVDLAGLGAWLPARHAPFAEIPCEPASTFNIIYSSGTTGTPKGIVHTHGLRWTQAMAWKDVGFGEATTLIATPIYSNTTLGMALFPTLVHGGTAVLMGKFDARRFVEIAERRRVTHTTLVPVQYQRIMAVPDFDRFDLSSFQLKMATGAPFPVETKRDVVARWPGALLELYGMTEGGGTTILNATQFPEKLDTVGTPPPGNEIRLIDEAGQEVPRGEIGEVVGRSAVMMQGYHRRAEATSAAEWVDADGKRFIRHGDLGRFDEDGFLILLGRSKDMIISGGFNIYPADIEGVIDRHPAVAEAAVVGVPSAAWGETPFAFVTLRPGMAIEASELVAWVNERVGRTQRISGALAIEEMPRGSMGKVLKRELRDRIAKADPA